MAKKKAASKEPAMAEQIRDLLTATPTLSLKETLEIIKAKSPEPVNEKSFGVAFYNARNKLGIKSPGSKKVVRKKVPSSSAAAPARAASSAGSKWSILQAAARFLSEAGSADAAIEAIKQVQSLQVK